MRRQGTLIFSFVYLLLITSQVLHASDLEKEQRMKDQVIDYILNGEAVMLEDGPPNKGHQFLSIFTEAETDTPKGAVIIMHGRGYHPDWPELVYPLRTGLPGYGWHTLSIQMPVLDNEATFYDYLDIIPEGFPRMDAAVAYLRQKNIQNIVLLAHSCSVHFSIAWLHRFPDRGISAYIGVGMGSTDRGQPMPEPFPLQDIKIPILDIRGEYDYPAVIGDAPDRWKRMQQAGNKKSQQRVVKKSDHYFTGRGDALLIEVADWLNTL